MRQVTLNLRDENDHPPRLLEPDGEQQLIALMAQCLLAVVQHQGETDHDAE